MHAYLLSFCCGAVILQSWWLRQATHDLTAAMQAAADLRMSLQRDAPATRRTFCSKQQPTGLCRLHLKQRDLGEWINTCAATDVVTARRYWRISLRCSVRTIFGNKLILRPSLVTLLGASGATTPSD